MYQKYYVIFYYIIILFFVINNNNCDAQYQSGFGGFGGAGGLGYGGRPGGYDLDSGRNSYYETLGVRRPGGYATVYLS